MAGPLGFLSLGARLAAPIIRGAVWLGRTVLETTRDILASGVGALDREIAALHRAEAAIKIGTESIVAAEHDLPDVAGIPEAITFQRREYAYTVKISYVDPNTGRPAVRYVTVSTDTRLSPSDAKRSAEDLAFEEYDMMRRSNLISSEVTGITRAAPGRRL